MAELLDQKIKSYLENAYTKAKTILIENKDLIEKMCKILLEKEYLSSEEFVQMMNGDTTAELPHTNKKTKKEKTE